MAVGDSFRRVGEDFKLSDEVLVVINDVEEAGDGTDPEPVALVFYRDHADHDRVHEYGPNAVDDALSYATSQAAAQGRQIVVQMPDEATWWPHWGTLI